MQNLVNNGYVRDQTVRAAPYDWRVGPRKYGVCGQATCVQGGKQDGSHQAGCCGETPGQGWLPAVVGTWLLTVLSCKCMVALVASVLTPLSGQGLLGSAPRALWP